MSKKNLINSTAQNTFLKTSFKKTDYKESKKSKDYLKKIIKLLDN